MYWELVQDCTGNFYRTVPGIRSRWFQNHFNTVALILYVLGVKHAMEKIGRKNMCSNISRDLINLVSGVEKSNLTVYQSTEEPVWSTGEVVQSNDRVLPHH